MAFETGVDDMVTYDLGLEAISVPPDREWGNGFSTWRLLLVSWGDGVFRSDSAAHALRCREGLLVPAGVEGVLKSGPRSDLAGSCFHFCPEHLSGVLTLAERLLFQRAAGRLHCVRVLKAGNPLLQRFEDVTKSSSLAGSLERRCDLLRLIEPLMGELRESLRHTPDVAGEASLRLVAILEEVTEADLQHLAVSDLARKCGCSRRHLSRLVRDRFGCSILSLKTELRLERAAMLLRDPDAKIIGVSLECGFNHLGSFTSKFRKRFGATPGKWREKILANERMQPARVNHASAQARPVGGHAPAGGGNGEQPKVPPFSPKVSRDQVPAIAQL